MSAAQQARQALDVRHLRERFPAKPEVVDVRFEVGLDSTGDEAVFVWIILSDKTPKRDFARDRLSVLEGAVRSALTEKQVYAWPYVRFRTESEQRDIDVAPTLV